MGGSPENGVDLEIIGPTSCPTEEEGELERRRYVERYKGQWVYFSDDRRGKMSEDSAHN